MATETDKLKEKCNPVCNVVIRQVANGFVVQGATQWIDRETEQVAGGQNDEVIAVNADYATSMVSNYLNSSTFNRDTSEQVGGLLFQSGNE